MRMSLENETLQSSEYYIKSLSWVIKELLSPVVEQILLLRRAGQLLPRLHRCKVIPTSEPSEWLLIGGLMAPLRKAKKGNNTPEQGFQML